MNVVPRPADPAESSKGTEKARKAKNQAKNARRPQKKKEKQKQIGDSGHDTSVSGTLDKPVTTDKPTSTDNKSTSTSDNGGGRYPGASKRRPKRKVTHSPVVPTDDDAMPKTENHIITKNKPVISDGSAVKDKHDVEKKPAIESETAIENVPSTENESGSDNQSTAEKHFEPDASTSKTESDTSINASSDTFGVTSGQLTVTARVLMTKSVASSSSSGEGLHTLNNAVRAALAVTTRALARLSETQEQVASGQDELEDTLEELAHVRNELDGTQDQLERAQEKLAHVRNELDGTQDQLERAQEKLVLAQLQVKETMAQLNGTQGELTGFGEAIWEMEEGLRELCERLVHVLRV